MSSMKERLHTGELYLPGDEEIMKEQVIYQDLLCEYNLTRPSEYEKRSGLLKQMLGDCGEGVYIEAPFYSNFGGRHCHFGNMVYANYHLTCVDDTHIYIGDHTMLGPNVTIATAGHPILPELRERLYQYNMPVYIGKNCWIGAGAIIMPGVTIGDNTVIGAGSIVTKDIPADVVAVGNPCHVMREIGEHDREYYFRERKIPETLDEIYAPFGVSKNEITDDFLSKPVIADEVLGKSNLKVNPKWYLILEAVRELNGRTYSLKVGRTIYQKVCYVMTRNGVNTGFTFIKGSYGPYSTDVKDSITALANANLIIEQTLGRMVSLSVPDHVVIQEDKFSREEWSAMKKTVDLFGRVKSTDQAEMIATVLYSYDELNNGKQKISDKDVYDYVMSWKPYWKQEKDYKVCDTIHNLAMLSLISVVHSNLLLDTLLF